MPRNMLPGGGSSVPRGANRGSVSLNDLAPRSEPQPLPPSNPHNLTASIPKPLFEPTPTPKRQKKFL